MKCLVCGSKTVPLFKKLYDDRYGSPGYFSVYSCGKCGFGRTDPVLERKEIGKFYKKYYSLSGLTPTKVRNSIDTSSRFISWLFGTDATAHKYIRTSSKVLDVGSGSGSSLLEIKRKGSTGFGVEPDPNAQRIAKKLKLNVFKGFLTDNPFPDRKFDYVTVSQVLEHEPDPLRFLISAKNKLKPDGQIVLAFPNASSIYRKLFGKKWLNWHIPYHINFFTKGSFKRLTKKAGLKVISYRTITPNIWTVFQIKGLFVKTGMGRKNHLWMNRKESGFSRLLNIALFIVVTPVNRFVDMFGVGDSIFVTLRK